MGHRQRRRSIGHKCSDFDPIFCPSQDIVMAHGLAQKPDFNGARRWRTPVAGFIAIARSYCLDQVQPTIPLWVIVLDWVYSAHRVKLANFVFCIASANPFTVMVVSS
jgi:hypothetical protein